MLVDKSGTNNGLGFIVTMVVFDIIVLVRRLKRFLLTGGGRVRMLRFSLNVKPEVVDAMGNNAHCSIGLFPLKNSYTVTKRSTRSSDPKAFGSTPI